MSSLEAKKISPEAKKSDQFSALLAFADVHDLTAAALAGAISRLYPGARVMGWGGSGDPTEGDHGILLSVNSIDLSVTNIRTAAPPQAFTGGNQPDFCWQNAKAELNQHRSHMFVIEAAARAMAESVERARAVTMVVDAVADLKRPMGLSPCRQRTPPRSVTPPPDAPPPPPPHAQRGIQQRGRRSSTSAARLKA